jgi:hypothetical protein
MAIEDVPIDRYERALTLRNLLVAACEGETNANDSDYRHLRREFMQDPETAALLPQFVRTCPNLHQFWGFIKDKEQRWEPRRQFVRSEFAPLINVIEDIDICEGRADPLTDESGHPIYGEDGRQILLDGDPAPMTGVGFERGLRPRQIGDARKAALGSEALGAIRGEGALVAPEGGQAAPVASSAWTGRVTSREQARVVLSLAPSAIQGVRNLLANQEKRLHNKPPEALPGEDLQALRELHLALGNLIALAEQGDPLDETLTRLAGLKERVFNYAEETGQLTVAGLRPLIASQPAAWATYAVLGLICAPATFATLGPAAALMVCAGYFGLDVKRQPKR